MFGIRRRRSTPSPWGHLSFYLSLWLIDYSQLYKYILLGGAWWCLPMCAHVIEPHCVRTTRPSGLCASSSSCTLTPLCAHITVSRVHAQNYYYIGPRQAVCCGAECVLSRRAAHAHDTMMHTHTHACVLPFMWRYRANRMARQQGDDDDDGSAQSRTVRRAHRHDAQPHITDAPSIRKRSSSA